MRATARLEFVRAAAVAAFPEAAAPLLGFHAPSLLHLPVSNIKPNPHTLRQSINEAALDSLAESIKRWGQLQPIVVQRVDDAYVLVFGERRWRAHQRAGLDMIWALERQVAESERLALALVENLQRVGLSHAEKVAALDQLAEMSRIDGLRQTAHRIRITPGWLSSQLAVRGDPVIFPALEKGLLSFGQAAELMRAPVGKRGELLDRTLAHSGRVPTATIRAWAAEARTQQRRVRRSGESQSAFARVLATVRELPRPSAPADVAALQAIVAQAQRLLKDTDQIARGWKSISIEMKCLLCGEPAGALVDGAFRPRAAAAVRLVEGRLTCGRCGGSLASGELTQRYSYY